MPVNKPGFSAETRADKTRRGAPRRRQAGHERLKPLSEFIREYEAEHGVISENELREARRHFASRTTPVGPTPDRVHTIGGLLDAVRRSPIVDDEFVSDLRRIRRAQGRPRRPRSSLSTRRP